jgi:hypothetical protein
METFATWATVLVVKDVAIIGAIGEAVVTCGHEVPHDTGVIEPGEIPTRVGLVIFLGTRGARRSRRPLVGPRLTTYGTPEGLGMPLRKRPPKRGRLVGQS